MTLIADGTGPRIWRQSPRRPPHPHPSATDPAPSPTGPARKRLLVGRLLSLLLLRHIVQGCRHQTPTLRAKLLPGVSGRKHRSSDSPVGERFDVRRLRLAISDQDGAKAVLGQFEAKGL